MTCCSAMAGSIASVKVDVPVAVPAALTASRRLRLATFLFGGAGLLGLGSVLPWFREVERGTSTVTYQGGGGGLPIAIALAIAVCAYLYLTRSRGVPLKLTLLFLPVLNAVLSLLTVSGHGFPETNEYFSSAFYIGFYASVVGTMSVLVGAALTLREPRESPVGDGGTLTARKKPMPIALIVGLILLFFVGLVAACGLLPIGEDVTGERPVDRVVGAVADPIEDAEDVQQAQRADQAKEQDGNDHGLHGARDVDEEFAPAGTVGQHPTDDGRDD